MEEHRRGNLVEIAVAIIVPDGAAQLHEGSQVAAQSHFGMGTTAAAGIPG